MLRDRKNGDGVTNARVSLLLVVLRLVFARLGETMIMVGVGITLFAWMGIRDLKLVDRINGGGAQSVSFLLGMGLRAVQLVVHISAKGV
jgi:hypothetical protein